VNLVVLIQGLEEDKGASGVQVKPVFRIVNIYFWGATGKKFVPPLNPSVVEPK
jgi:hypothetical protein